MTAVNKDFGNIKLPSPPAIAVRIIEAVKKEETSFDELSRIIMADPALTSKVLRAANSPMYAIPSKVDNHSAGPNRSWFQCVEKYRAFLCHRQ